MPARRRAARGPNDAAPSGAGVLTRQTMENIAEKDELLKISEHYAELPADKRAQFRALVRQNGIDVGQLPIVPLPRETDLFPLSIAQERLWFLWKLDPESAGYVVPRSVRVRGPLARDALRGVLSELVVRHPALRTLFVDVDGDARQRVRDEPVYGWVEKDLSALPKPEREAAASHALQGIAGAPFDLERGPLFRAALLKLGDDDHVFHLSMHHIVTDGWSMSVLVKELLDLYHARATGRGATLPDAAISYADYAGWQREWLDDAALDAQIGYWRALLGDVDAYPPLPFDRAPGAARDGVGGNVATTLDAAVAQRLRELARRAGATLPMVLMAALDVLLYRYTGQADVRVGMPVSGRESPDVAPLVGFFVNTLVIRADVSPAATFGALVAQVRERMLEAQNHQNVPFSRLVDALQPVRRTGETPLFNVTFNHQRGVDVPDAPVAGLRIEPFDAADGVAQFDLGLDIVETRDALHVTFSYARDVFDAATVERLCAHYVGLLDDVSRAPGMTIDALDLLGERERQTLLARGRGPEQDAAPAVVHERIAARAHERGDATALICDGEALDYRALNARANRLAHRLTKLGVGPDVRVGLAVERSVDLAVALLAILKAGGAYVPLDPSYPHERLAYMIADSGVALLLTQSRAAGRLPASPGVHVLAIDEEDVSGEPSADPRVKAQRANLAYVIYTSGSTGRPKGVAMAHDAFARHVQVSTGFFGIGSDDRVLQFSTANFDGFVEQLFPALCVGATVVMRGPALWDSGRFRDEVRRHGITVADLTTAYWQMLVQDFAALPDADLGPLRRVHAGGEAMSASALRKWRGLYAGKIGLRNTYGPTEAAVTVSAFDCDRVPADEPGAMSAVPLGDPLGGRCLYVLDASLRVVPPGVTGELYIGGDLLARGYLNRPGLTAERFVPDPWSATGGRLYRTGDLVRWNANGQLDYLGRVDHQVKVRGFRIEPAEIDAQLLACDGVREAVVIPRDSGEGTRLIAYVTPHHGHTLDTAALRARLATTLPDYMVPSALVVLDALPLNPNGKLDRHALPAPTFGTRACEAPLGATETVLADVWRDVLGVERVGRHDNFFELGGDSILSLKAVARSVRAGIAITPRQLFEHQTVAQLAGAIAPADAEEAAAAPLVRVPGDGALPLSYAQQRLWFLWNLQPDSSAYHVGGGLRLAGALDVDALRASLDAVVLRQASLRTTFDADSDGNVSQRIAAQPDYDYRFVDLSGAADAEADAATLAARVRAKPFDLVAGPLLRVAVIRLNASGHILVMVMHHIVTDGWSVDVLLRELVAHYRARLDGEAAAVAALPVQYADYAVWQRRYLDGGARERQLAYWREQLGGEQPVLLLPADRPRHALADSQAACHQVALDAGLADAIRGMARARGATPFMVLLSAFYVTLHRHTGQHDIRVGVPIANRERVEVEGLIGFFANTQVLRADLHGVADLGALLDQVKTRALDAQAHQDLPFDVLVDALGVERSLTHTPLFQVMFNYQKEDYRVLDELPGLRVSGYDAGPGAAQFELTLNVIEDGDGDITLSFVYAAGLFDAGTIERFGRHYRAVLEAVVRDPATAIGEVGLLDDGERGTLLEWGSACSVDEATLPLHGQIARQAARRPDAVAVVCEGHALSYGELNARANRLAHRLIALGVGPEVRVGLAMERSLELVVGLLAILKAGGAYVPLDPSYPQDRLAYMIGDSGIALLLAQSAVVERLPSSCDVRTLLIDALDVSAEPATDPVVTVHESNLAYVIYTSGSTGRPKGAQLTHRNVARLLTSTQHGFDFNENDVWTLFHSYAFDFSVWEIFGALCHGGRLVVVPYLVSRSPEEFVELLNREQVTVLNQTPSAFRQLMAVPGLYDGRDLSLRLVIFGGEALEPQTLRPWFDHFGDAKPRLVNMYGITETTVHVTYRPITQADLNGQRSPVGERIQDLGVYVLDAQMNLSPVGVEGELYVSGEGLSRGYLNRAGLTAERFVPNPFVQDGSRLYRTGDLARWNAQGELEYAGRLDHQVKVRGFRIELGEIEAQLLKQAGVSEAVVLTQESASGTRLVGYVTARNDAPLDGQSLRSRLAQTLPDYMVPSVVMVLESLPLTPNGKLDRRALPEPENTPSREHDHEAPQGETETTLAQIWQHVLGVPRVGRHDNFFELGGDSILSLQIVARARQSGLKLTARQMFEQQTVAQLATVAQPLDVHQARNEPIEGEAPLLPIQSWFFEHEIPNRHHWNQAVLLTSRDALDVPSLERSLVEVVNHHASLRLRYVQHAPGQWTQTYATDAAASDLLWVRHAAGLDEMQTLCDDAQRSLDLARGPLLRALLLRLPDGSERLLLAAHHLVVDGVSWRILLDDLRTAYGQARAGDAIQLPHSTDSYRQWASRLAAHAQGDTVRAELPYWLSVLDTPSQLPDVRAAGAATLRHERRTGLTLTREATSRLLHDAPAAFRTQVNDLLLTALGRALCRWTGESSIRIDVEGHGREDLFDGIDVSRTVGWFTSLYPVRLEPLGDPGDALLRVKESLRAAPQRGLGYGLLRYAGAGVDRRALSAAPRSSVVFNYLGQFDGSFDEAAAWRPARETPGATRDADSPLEHELSVNGQVYGGELKLTLGYSAERHREAAIDALVRSFRDELEQLIAHCTSGAAGVSPSDFPLAALAQPQLDALRVPAAAIEDLYPLSPMQQGMLFHTLYEPHGGAYLTQLSIGIEGLDVERFRRAWQTVTARHEILRTGFVPCGDRWMQCVVKSVEAPFAAFDWRGRDDQDAALRELAAAEVARGFDLQTAPLHRLVLVRTGGRRHHFVWTHHHMLLDGWSVSQLLGEVLRAYEGKPLPPSGGRYRDYIAWRLSRDVRDDEAWWRAQLARLDAPTRLAGAPDPARGESGQGDCTVTLDAALADALSAFAKRERVTLNTVVQGAWALLLSRCTGQRVVTFGATVAGRPEDVPGAQRMMGLFINTVPVIVGARADRRVGDWLRDLQAQNVEMREHEFTPLHDIQQWAGAGGGLFDSIVVFENYPVDSALKDAAPDGLAFDEASGREQTNYPLTVVVTQAGGLSLQYGFDRRFFDAETVERIAGWTVGVLKALVDRAERAVGEIALGDDGERGLLLGWGSACSVDEAVLPLHEQIARQAARRADAVAVVCEGHALSYGELNARANRLAHRLIALGVGPEVRVGLAMERSLELVVGLLAILKAGGAYVPLDPSYPLDRLAYMIGDSGIALLLAQSSVVERLPSSSEVRTLLIDTLDVSMELATDPLVPVHESNLAYVIYTSGSTGRPKGAQLTHRNVARLLTSTQHWFDFNENDVWTLFHSYAFDFSVWEIFGALCHGGRLVVVPYLVSRSPEEFAELLHRERVTVLNQTPSAFRQLMAVPGLYDGKNLSLRLVIFGGEALEPQTLRPWFDHFGDEKPRLVNMYGITETTVHVTYRPITQADLNGQR
ncbi:non-ribosomal peptide synthase protein (TIGR01720 family)/amino acid adenylation domain-containing protein, partial [Paraburkholderia caballeronis]